VRGRIKPPSRPSVHRERRPATRAPIAFAEKGAAWSPPVDVEETDDAYVIEAELSSVKREA